MRNYTLPLIFSLISQIVFSQASINSESLKTFSFLCYNQTDSIKLPKDFIGPDYFNYEEGSIVSFMSSDAIIISILCGGNASMTLDSLYNEVDSLKTNGRIVSIRFKNVKQNKYARQDYFEDFDILYQDVPFERKDEFDYVFDRLRDKRQIKK